MAEVHYLISDASKQVDVESHVLRYWEDELELDIPRNDMGHRYYTEYHIRLFRQIKELKEKGYQLKAIKNALNKMSGVEEKITITEDYMEEDMKAAWDKGREKEAENVWVSEPPEGQSGDGAEAGQGRSQRSVGVSEEQKGSQRTAGLREDQRSSQGASGAAEDQRGPQRLDSGQNQGNQQKEHSKVQSVEGVREHLKARLAEQSRVRVVEGGGMPAEMVQRNTRRQTEPVMREPAEISAEKMARFQSVMNHIIGRAMDANMDRLAREVSNTVSEDVTDKVMKEVEYLMRISDEKEEERFRQLDETIRAYQKQGKGRAEAAATKVPFFKKKKFARNGKKLF